MMGLARELEGLEGAGWDGLRALMTGGERLDDDTYRHLTERFAGRLWTAYGSTEVPRVTEAGPAEMLARPGTVGRLTPLHDVRVVGPNDEVLPHGSEGEGLGNGIDMFTGHVRAAPIATPYP